MKDVFVKFTKKTNSKDIPGESTDAEHKGWLEVASWNQGIQQPTCSTASTAGGHSVGRCEHAPMTFSKDIDKASVYLWEACSAAYAYDVEIRFFRSSGTVRTNYLTINMYNAIVSDVETSSPLVGLPVEFFKLKYAKITWAHKGSKSDGSANVGLDAAGWDLSLNKATA